jgi:preprotein translocase subunit YajC
MPKRSVLVLLSVAILMLIPAARRALAQTTKPAPKETTLREVTQEPSGDEAAAEVQTDQAPASQPGEEGQRPTTLWETMRRNQFLFIMIGGFILLYVWMGRSRRKQEAKRKAMLANLKKGDKVTSIGGIIGTVIEVREDEVTVKVDETNNVRMKFARWAIRGVGEEARTDSPEGRA